MSLSVMVQPGASRPISKRPIPKRGDAFGGGRARVAIFGDTVVIGADVENGDAKGVNGDQNSNGYFRSGAAYVFTRSGTTWSQQAYLKASNNSADFGIRFGYSVAIAGETVVVGGMFDRSNATGVNGDQNDSSAISSGAAYVFTRSGTTWTQQAYLKASNTDVGDLFGVAVAITGDTAVVGAEGEDSNATGVNGDQSDNSYDFAGAAYIFTRDGTTWSQQAYLKASNTYSDDGFGQSVAISDDTVVVGAYYKWGETGAAYVFTRIGAAWSQQAYLQASNVRPTDRFGQAVAISGDTIMVGAWLEDSNATGVNGDQLDNSFADAGAVYLFTRSGTAWTQQAYLKASNTGAGDNFGVSMAISGDTVVIGAQGEASNATGVNGSQSNDSFSGAGAAYVFKLDLNSGQETIFNGGFED